MRADPEAAELPLGTGAETLHQQPGINQEQHHFSRPLPETKRRELLERVQYQQAPTNQHHGQSPRAHPESSSERRHRHILLRAATTHCPTHSPSTAATTTPSATAATSSATGLRIHQI